MIGLSRTKGNFHVRFLEEGEGVIPSSYSTTKKYIDFLETGRMTSRLFAGYCVDCAGIKGDFKSFYHTLDSALKDRGLIEEETISNVPEAEKVAKLVLSDFGYKLKSSAFVGMSIRIS